MDTRTVTNCPLKPLQSALCYCGKTLHTTNYGGNEFLQCPLHGRAYKADALEIARTLPRPA
jgi:hypothetical protein